MIDASLEQKPARRWLWCGPMVDGRTMLRRRAVSAAANRWQLGLLGALRAMGEPVTITSFAPEPAWPRGALHARGSDCRPFRGPADVGVDYLNLPVVREMHLCISHLVALSRMVEAGGPPESLVTYNALPAYRAFGLEAQRRYGVPWVPVIADLPEPDAPGPHDAAVARAAGRVYLSHGSFLHSAHAPKLHLDGGVTRLPALGGPLPSSRALLFTGLLTRSGGIHLLIEAFRSLHDPRAELWICGRGADEEVRRAAARDPRVTVHGLVDEAKLQSLSEAAWAFVNPRPPSIAENAHNFPSKVLEYLTYGKPVVSTWTAGLAPEYREVLMVAEGEEPAALTTRLADALALAPAALLEHREVVRAFLAAKKLWSVQAERLRSWLAEVQRRKVQGQPVRGEG
jgi:glycosyltransferase involved in cell wall biosynthesis